eukprot:c18769_g1_i2.p2 GENE.c18769_g1_i2~~c18769_g1_i2.p2  ORF type:complete len:112 (+),score=25.40 c18769_g1_i2:202-537(+)
MSLTCGQSCKPVRISSTHECIKWTPLVLAAVNNHIEVVRLLIQLKANVNCADNNGWTPLYIAARCGHFAVVQELLDHGGNVNVFDAVSQFRIVRLVILSISTAKRPCTLQR